jgi:hypothetical protein
LVYDSYETVFDSAVVVAAGVVVAAAGVAAAADGVVAAVVAAGGDSRFWNLTRKKVVVYRDLVGVAQGRGQE